MLSTNKIFYFSLLDVSGVVHGARGLGHTDECVQADLRIIFHNIQVIRVAIAGVQKSDPIRLQGRLRYLEVVQLARRGLARPESAPEFGGIVRLGCEDVKAIVGTVHGAPAEFAAPNGREVDRGDVCLLRRRVAQKEYLYFSAADVVGLA